MGGGVWAGEFARPEVPATDGPPRLLCCGVAVERVLCWDRRRGSVAVVVRADGVRLWQVAEDKLTTVPAGADLHAALARLAGVVIGDDGELTRADGCAGEVGRG